MRRRAALILCIPVALLALFPALEPFAHGHDEDGADHHDCPICNLLHAAGVTVDAAVADTFAALTALPRCPDPLAAAQPRMVSTPGRSPPAPRLI